MMKPRVIPVLLLSQDGLVKTKQFKQPRYVGDPINAVKIFNDKEVDELVLLDIDASKRGKGPNYAVIESVANECFMPFAYGGGVDSVEQIRTILKMGVEKVIINTAALKDVRLITQAASEFGSQAIVVSVDVKKNFWGKYKIFSAAGASCPKHSLIDYVRALEAAGAGELVLNSVDRDGLMSGYDVPLVRQVSDALTIPVVALGGAGSLSDMKLVIESGRCAAVAAGSMFVFHGAHKAVLITYPTFGEISAGFKL